MWQLCILLSVVVAPLSNAYKVAIIGGGISGTFTAKYLAEFDANHRHRSSNDDDSRDCLLDEIVVYDVSPPPPGFTNNDVDVDISTTDSNKEQSSTSTKKLQSSSEPRPSNYQGSRVSSIKLQDGSVVELGASIIYNGNKLVVDMINNDPDRLKRIKPLGTGKEEKDNKKTSGFGIYHGNKEWLLNLSSFGVYPSFIKSILQSLYILYRYNIDFFRLRRTVKTAIHSFDMIYQVLNDTEHDVTYFDTPQDIWNTMGLGRLASVSFHDFLDGLGLYRDASLELKNIEEESSYRKEGSWFDWRRYIPGMGCLRSELVTGMTINTYNQNLNEMNGLVGLVSYVPAGAGGELFSIKGGNHLLMESALWQTREIYNTSSCTSTSTSSSNKQRIQRYQKTITTVVARENYMELYAEGFELLGQFDVVILAAPLQQCRIQFLQSGLAMDASILHEMPLGDLKENLDSEDETDDSDSSATNEHGEHLFASSLPSSATIPYTSVVTTLISNATLNATHFGLQDEKIWPRSILVSERGKALEGITTLTILSAEQGLIKTFSSEELTLEQRTTLFGTDHIVEYVQVWGGEDGYGGATPNFGGGRHSKSLPFLLYDGAKHWGKGNSGDGPALYYVNAIESSVAAIEISAIGSKSSAKLVARRLGLITPKKKGSDHDEL